MRYALMYGTFGPLTPGHLWLTSAGLRLFDWIVVAVAPLVGRESIFKTVERSPTYQALY